MAETDAFKEQLDEANVQMILESQCHEAYKDLSPELKAFLPEEFLDEFVKAITPFTIENAPTILDALMPHIGVGINKGL